MIIRRAFHPANAAWPAPTKRSDPNSFVVYFVIFAIFVVTYPQPGGTAEARMQPKYAYFDRE